LASTASATPDILKANTVVESPSSDSDDESNASTVVQEKKETLLAPLKLDGRTILTTLKEETTDNNLQAVDAKEHRRLLVENQRLRDKLHSLRNDYDQRVTPFRDLFDERRKTRNENARLVSETKEMEEKLTTVQRKAMAAVHVSEQKIKFLQAKLGAANKENETLKQQLEG